MKTFFCAVAALLVTGAMLLADSTLWENAAYEDFAKGTLQNTVLFSDGTIHRGSKAIPVQTPELTLWSSVTDEEGNLYIGTGLNGVVYRLQKGTLEKYCETGELIVTSLVATRGKIYAGTIPNGKVFEIREGEAELVVQLPCPYIWSMHADGEKIYAGTGHEGTLYLVDLDYKHARVLVDTPEKHILSLAMDEGKNLYLGSSPHGILYQVTPYEDVVALMDLKENEIRALSVAGDTVYIGANVTEDFDDTQMVKTLVRKMGQEGKGKLLDRGKLLEKMVAGGLYKYNRERGARNLLRLEKNFITSLAVLPEERALVSTGLQGKIYEVRDDTHSVIYDLQEDQIMRLIVTDGDLRFFGTGDTGRLYRLDSVMEPTEASYLSEVHDGETFSHWSTIYWDCEGELRIQTRTGNTRNPDEYWSSWSREIDSSAPYVDIDSPAGRYFQYRVVWQEQDAVLKSVRVVYTRQNRRPEITELKLSLPTDNPRSLYREKVENPIKITWQAKDPDGEELRYRLWSRHLQTDRWVELTAGEVLTAKSWKWDIGHLPDGYYQLKLVAGDELVNSRPAYTEKILRPILVDNNPPTIHARVEKGEICGTVLDTFSIVTQIGYRVGPGDWTLVPSNDSNYDRQQESFHFSLPEMTPPYTVEIRSRDAGGNAGYAFCTVEE